MNSERPELESVIVPFLNESDWLVEALDSVMNQTCKQWELIVVDDGSNKEHSQVAKNYCRQHSDKMRYTEHEKLTQTACNPAHHYFQSLPPGLQQPSPRAETVQESSHT